MPTNNTNHTTGASTELEAKITGAFDTAAKAVIAAVEKAGSLAHHNRDKVEGLVDKAGDAFDKRTDGKYADRTAKARQSVKTGVAKLAEQSPSAREGGAHRPAAGSLWDAPVQDSPGHDAPQHGVSGTVENPLH